MWGRHNQLRILELRITNLLVFLTPHYKPDYVNILCLFLMFFLQRKDVGKEKINDAEPCHAKIRPIAVDTPQTAF